VVQNHDMSERDLSDPELLHAGDSPTGPFAEVALQRGGVVDRFRFGISAAGRALVQRVLGTRPFDATTDLPYRYFYAGQGGYGAPITHLLYVRVEHGRDARTLEFESPADLVAALEWFRQLPSLAAAAHLRAPA
jgi:hypothetical protein